MLLELRCFKVLPGQRMLLHDGSWDEFERILEELGDSRPSQTVMIEHLELSEMIGRTKALRVFRQWVRSQIA